MDPIKINLNPLQDLGESNERLTILCSKEFRRFIEHICSIWGCTVSEACHRYILEGMREDLSTIFMAEPYLDKSLREILRKN